MRTYEAHYKQNLLNATHLVHNIRTDRNVDGSKIGKGTIYEVIKGEAAYQIEQSIEKIIKSEILNVEPNINMYLIHHHRIRDLCMVAKQLSIDIPKEIIKCADMYTKWEATGRYPGASVFNLNSIEKAIRITKKWIDIIDMRSTQNRRGQQTPPHLF